VQASENKFPRTPFEFLEPARLDPAARLSQVVRKQDARHMRMGNECPYAMLEEKAEALHGIGGFRRKAIEEDLLYSPDNRLYDGVHVFEVFS
jgi:hypothetical protein